MKILVRPGREQWPQLMQRPVLEWTAVAEQVRPILQDVKQHGDEAVRRCTRRFDKVELREIAVSRAMLEEAAARVPQRLQAAIRAAAENISRFHAPQQEASRTVTTAPGVTCWRRSVAIERIGIYVPGGTAPLFSTVLMLAVPARLAGCREVRLCTPPGADGELHPAILFAAQTAGVQAVYRAGGAQAIAALAYGTESIPAVDKIVGPGNQYVMAAKQLVSQNAGVAIDLPAGPSELLVIADGSARPEFVAADLLSQAEHLFDSQVLLLCTDEALARAVAAEVERQLPALTRRAYAEASLGNSRIIVLASLAEAMEFSNCYAPEHLSLAVQEPERLAELVVNAGSVFMGHFSGETLGDYISGTNHVLPTNGWARAYAGVSLDSFVKKITFQEVTAEGLRQIGPAAEVMAEAEGLTAHKEAVSIRLRSIDAGRN